MELSMIQFLKKLPQRERNFYLLMNSYNLHLNNLSHCNNETQQEGSKLLSEFFESEILKLVVNEVQSTPAPFYENHITIDEKAEKSTSEINKFKIVNLADKEFNEKLGEWASSFSNSDDENDTNEKRLANESDLSSSSDNEQDTKILNHGLSI